MDGDPSDNIDGVGGAGNKTVVKHFPWLNESTEHTVQEIISSSENLKNKYKWFNFGDKWDLIKPSKENALDFLYSLDLFVYPLGHKFIESWGRSTVEAMLTGCIPIVQSGHNLENIIIHGVTGFICDDFYDTKNTINNLYNNIELKNKISRQCREHAADKICNREQHLSIWRKALNE
jgi:glycosyltransferase involved in cell wall biosynthesis